MFQQLSEANRSYAEHFHLQGIPPRAAKGFGLVTCMDSRIEPLVMLGLEPGDAKILRNAGGRVTDDVLRSLILATNFLEVREVAIMQHTRCALAHTSEGDMHDDLARAGQSDRAAEAWEFLAMEDPDESLRADVEKVRSCALLAEGVLVEGWRYDVDTGLVARIVQVGT